VIGEDSVTFRDGASSPDALAQNSTVVEQASRVARNPDACRATAASGSLFPMKVI
jgi:hypothetical protein